MAIPVKKSCASLRSEELKLAFVDGEWASDGKFMEETPPFKHTGGEGPRMGRQRLMEIEIQRENPPGMAGTTSPYIIHDI